VRIHRVVIIGTPSEEEPIEIIPFVRILCALILLQQVAHDYPSAARVDLRRSAVASLSAKFAW
jgi:hypothetical protein